MVRFRNYSATVYTFGTSVVWWSLIQSKVVKYANIRIWLWGVQRNYDWNSLWVQVDQNWWEANLDKIHEVEIWDIFEIKGKTYKVDKVIEHCNYAWYLDNYQVFLSKTE
jgi:hypothetical protein